MTTQHDERAELIRKLNFAADKNLMLPSAYAEAFRKAAAILEADAKGGEAECIDCKGTGLRDSGGTMPWGEPAYVPCDCQSNPQTQAQAQAGLEATDSERNRRIYDAATHAAAIAVFMTRMDAEHPDADDKGVSGWLEEAEERVKQRASQSLGATLNIRPQQAAQVPPFPNRILDLLREVADRKGTETRGPWEDGNGEPLQDDADAALKWLAAHGIGKDHA